MPLKLSCSTVIPEPYAKINFALHVACYRSVDMTFVVRRDGSIMVRSDNDLQYGHVSKLDQLSRKGVPNFGLNQVIIESYRRYKAFYQEALQIHAPVTEFVEYSAMVNDLVAMLQRAHESLLEGK